MAQQNKINKLVKIASQLQGHPFLALGLLRSPHIQTALSRYVLYFKTPIPIAVRKLINLPDGSKLAADCWWQSGSKTKPTVIILSGFEGYYGSEKSQSGRGMGCKAYHHGFNVIFLRNRGESDTIKLTTSLFDGLMEDLPIALRQIVNWGYQKLFIIGFSAGGETTLFTAAKLDKSIRQYIHGIVAISAPINMLDTWSHVEQNRLYDRFLLKQYKNLIRRRLRVDPPGTWDLRALKKIKTKQQWALAHLPTLGYPASQYGIEQYNHDIDLAPRLAQIKLPTLIIHARDDPITPAAPFADASASPNIITLIPKHGGHVGFISTKKHYNDLDHHWAQNRAIEFICALLQSETRH